MWDLLRHLLTAKGLHGTHSPFVYSLYSQVFHRDLKEARFDFIEEQRKQLLADTDTLRYEDLGAKRIKKSIAIKQIAQKSLKRAAWGRAFFRLVKHVNAKKILELGTSFGISTAYMALVSNQVKVKTIEGIPEISTIAHTFLSKNFDNVECIVGNLDEMLQDIVSKEETLDLVFFDANHTYEATVTYFQLCLTKSHPGSVFVLDDIYWSPGMKRAWDFIKNHPSTFQTIDLYEIGLVFFRQDQAKEHFRMRYFKI